MNCDHCIDIEDIKQIRSVANLLTGQFPVMLDCWEWDVWPDSVRNAISSRWEVGIRDDVLAWLDETCREEWRDLGSMILFKDGRDAVLFKMRWA
jgi:hypothetical protein